MARAICSRCVATTSGTLRSSAFIMSTISRGDARSIETVRGLRRSVSRGSNINELPSGEARPNLPDGSRVLQDNLEQHDETFFSGVIDVDVRRGNAQRADAAAAERVHEQSRLLDHCGSFGIPGEPRQRRDTRRYMELRQFDELRVSGVHR